MTASEISEPVGLASLSTLALEPGLQSLVDFAERTAQGVPHWRLRKIFELRKLAALAQLAPRMRIGPFDVRTEMHALVELRMPVASLAPGATDVVLGDRVELALRYPEEILYRPVSGQSIVQLLAPGNVHHPNVGPPFGAPQVLCLGVNVPRNYPLVEAVLASYAALSLQSLSLSLGDHAGVLCKEAVDFWQADTQRLPLTRDAFLAPPASMEDPS